MTAQDEMMAPISVPPPPREWPWAFIRRWRMSLGRHRGLQYWLLAQGFLIFLGLICLFVINGFVNGWRVAYDVSVLITSPWDTMVYYPWLALWLSLAGWLMAPAVAGAVVGYIITDTATKHRDKPPNMAPAQKGNKGGNYIPRLDRLLYKGHGYSIRLDFAEDFVKLHEENWNTAQAHWEMIVGDFLNSTAVDRDAFSKQAMKQAVNAAAVALPEPLDRCPKCQQSPENSKRNSNP